MKFSPKELLLAIISLSALVLGGKAANAATCESMTRLHLPHAKITQAQFITGGSFTPPGSPMELKDLPPFCRVTLRSSPAPIPSSTSRFGSPSKKRGTASTYRRAVAGSAERFSTNISPSPERFAVAMRAQLPMPATNCPAMGPSRWGIPRRSSISATAA